MQDQFAACFAPGWLHTGCETHATWPSTSLKARGAGGGLLPERGEDASTQPLVQEMKTGFMG